MNEWAEKSEPEIQPEYRVVREETETENEKNETENEQNETENEQNENVEKENVEKENVKTAESSKNANDLENSEFEEAYLEREIGLAPSEQIQPKPSKPLGPEKGTGSPD